jgi:hypothetical protein
MSRLHRDPIIQQYCQVDEATEKWPDMVQNLGEKLRRVREIEALITSRSDSSEIELLLRELRGLYRWTLDAFRMKGLVEAMPPHERRQLLQAPEVN